jgi:hypothetical protein
MRLLILSCSATKRRDSDLLPALERYEGPAYRLLRKALRELAEVHQPRVAILSAEFGLIAGDTPIPWYDRRIDAARAARLAPAVQQGTAALLDAEVTNVFVYLSRDYLPALGALPAGPWEVSYAHGGIGIRLGQLRRWLYASQQEVPRA